MITRLLARHALCAVLAAGLLLAGCQTDEPEPVEEPPPERAPGEPAPEPGETEPAEATPAEPDAKGLDWAVGQAPADAVLAVALANVADLEKNLKAVVGPDSDEMDLVAGLAEGLPAGAFDVAGPMVVILPAPVDDPKGRTEALPVRVLRVKDASAIKGEDAGAGIKAVEVEGGNPVYVLKLDGWALVCEETDPIKAVMRSEKKLGLSDDRKAALGAHALWGHVNTAALVTMAKEGIASLEEQMKEQGGQGQAMPPATVDLLHWLLDVAKEVTAIEMVGDVTADGIHLAGDVHLAEGSHMATMMESGQPLKSYDVGLPQSDDVILVAWAGMDWQKSMPAFQALIKPLIDLMAKGEDEETQKSLQKLWDAYGDWGKVMGQEFGLVLELPGPDQGLYRLVEVFGVKDVAAYKELMKTYMEDSSGFMDVVMGKFGMGGGMPGMPGALPFAKPKVEYKAEAETIAGVPVDIMHIRFDVEAPEGAQPEAVEQMKEMIDMLYGPDGMVFHMAVVEGKGVATMGGKEVMAEALKAMKGEAPDLAEAPKVAAALKQVPAGQPAMLISAANYVYFAMAFADRMIAESLAPEVLTEAKQAGHGPLARPEVQDFVRVTGHATADGVAFSVDVPASDLRAAVETAKKGGERMQFLMTKQQEMMQEQQGPPPQPAPTPTPTPTPKR